MKYAKIRYMDVSNGPGIRVSLFVQGCEFHCKNCFNQETWDFNKGREFTNSEIELILKLAKNEYVKGLSILGGEPLHPKNVEDVTVLTKTFKEHYPEKDIWLWTGNDYEDVKDLEIMSYLDYIVDGRYVDELHDFRLKYRGSSNQRVIELKGNKENKDEKIIY